MNAQMSVDDGGGRERKVPVDYPANSKKLREVKNEEGPAKEEVKKVITGNVVRRKRSLVSKIFGDVVAEDSGSVFEYLLTDVLIPAAKNLLYELVTEGAQRKLYGNSKPRSSGMKQGYTSYASRFVQGRNTPEPQTMMSRQERASHNFNNVILANRGDAEDVLEALRELIDRYEVATVSDFYELVGITSDFTDNKYGWTDLRAAGVQLVRGGWTVNMPRTQALTT